MGLDKKKVDTGFEQLDLDTVLYEYYKDCKDTFKIDRSIIYKNHIIQIKFLHYSTNDSLIHLPKKYLEIYKLNKFITHDFESFLKISSNDNILIDTVIRKNIFNSDVYEEEVLYGTILHPVVKFNPKGISIYYSYSIALTDIGIPVCLEYEYYSKLKTKSGY